VFGFFLTISVIEDVDAAILNVTSAEKSTLLLDVPLVTLYLTVLPDTLVTEAAPVFKIILADSTL
jgi:hypothetical protein